MEIEASLWLISLSTKLEDMLDLKIFSFWMLPQATENAAVGQMWPAGR